MIARPPASGNDAYTRPPWRSMACLVIARPRPYPPLGTASSPRENGWKIRSSSSRLTPPLIGDTDFEPLGRRLAGHGYARMLGRIFDGVADDVFERPVDQFAFDFCAEGALDTGCDRDLPRTGFECGVAEDFVQEFDDIKRVRFQRSAGSRSQPASVRTSPTSASSRSTSRSMRSSMAPSFAGLCRSTPTAACRRDKGERSSWETSWNNRCCASCSS